MYKVKHPISAYKTVQWPKLFHLLFWGPSLCITDQDEGRDCLGDNAPYWFSLNMVSHLLYKHTPVSKTGFFFLFRFLCRTRFSYLLRFLLGLNNICILFYIGQYLPHEISSTTNQKPWEKGNKKPNWLFKKTV